MCVGVLLQLLVLIAKLKFLVENRVDAQLQLFQLGQGRSLSTHLDCSKIIQLTPLRVILLSVLFLSEAFERD